MQDTPKVTSEVTPQSMYAEYYMHSFLTKCQQAAGFTLSPSIITYNHQQKQCQNIHYLQILGAIRLLNNQLT